MKLQYIVDHYKKKSWLRLCTLHNIDKWELINFLNEPLYANKQFLIDGLELKTRNCYKCGTLLSLGIYKEKFTASPTCQCYNDGVKAMTATKLLCVFTEAQVEKIFKDVLLARRKGLPNTMEYWISKGCSVEEAQIKRTEIQKARSDKSPASKKGADRYSQRVVKYWTDRGYTIEQAKLKIKEVQTTNGLKFYTEKYGNEGKYKFDDRIARWLNSAGNKNMIANRSKKSLQLFEAIGCGSYGVDEKTVRGKERSHRVDFIFNDKIIEFYGDYWHGNPRVFASDAMIRNKKVLDIWAHDANKIQDLKDNGYSVLIIWEYDFNKDPSAILKKCKDFIA